MRNSKLNIIYNESEIKTKTKIEKLSFNVKDIYRASIINNVKINKEMTELKYMAILVMEIENEQKSVSKLILFKSDEQEKVEIYKSKV